MHMAYTSWKLFQFNSSLLEECNNLQSNLSTVINKHIKIYEQINHNYNNYE